MEPVKTYKMNQSLIKLQIYGGTIFGVLYLFMIYMNPGIPAYNFGFIIVVVAMGFWNKSRSPVKCYEDYMEVKLAPIAPLHLVKYQDITDIDESNRKYTRVAYNESGQEKSFKLHWNGLEASAQQELLPFVQQKC